MSETAVGKKIAEIFQTFGGRLWRNNSGAIQTIEGRYIRFGLGNTSSKLNQSIKSSDYIGIQPITIQPHHVGSIVGVFVSFEVKKPGGKTDKSRLAAQKKWLHVVKSLGGITGIVTSPSEIPEIIGRYL